MSAMSVDNRTLMLIVMTFQVNCDIFINFLKFFIEKPLVIQAYDKGCEEKLLINEIEIDEDDCYSNLKSLG